MQIGPERPDERGRVPATAVASHGTGGTGGHGWGHRRLLAGRFWRLWVPEGLRCEDGVCSGYGVQDARLWCKDWHAACPASPPSHAWVGNGMVLGPSSQCRFSPALLQGSGGLHGAVQTPNPPSETPGVSVGNIQAAGVSKPRHRAPEEILQPRMCCLQHGEGKQGGDGVRGVRQGSPFSSTL